MILRDQDTINKSRLFDGHDKSMCDFHGYP
jgi:hypothetical protein